MVIVMNIYKYVEVVHFNDPEVIDYFMELQKEVFDGLLYVKCLENNKYLALWQIGIEGITLYRKVACKYA